MYEGLDKKHLIRTHRTAKPKMFSEQCFSLNTIKPNMRLGHKYSASKCVLLGVLIEERNISKEHVLFQVFCCFAYELQKTPLTNISGSYTTILTAKSSTLSAKGRSQKQLYTEGN